MVNSRKPVKDLSLKTNAYAPSNNLRKNKTLGSDSLIMEFYLRFWEYVATSLKDCLNHAYQRGKMSISQKRAVISPLPKKNKDTLKTLVTDYVVEH